MSEPSENSDRKLADGAPQHPLERSLDIPPLGTIVAIVHFKCIIARKDASSPVAEIGDDLQLATQNIGIPSKLLAPRTSE
jgi:hypothetical protein